MTLQLHYLISSDMKAFNNSHIIQLVDIFQVLKVVIIVVVVYAKLLLFTQSICFVLHH